MVQSRDERLDQPGSQTCMECRIILWYFLNTLAYHLGGGHEASSPSTKRAPCPSLACLKLRKSVYVNAPLGSNPDSQVYL